MNILLHNVQKLADGPAGVQDAMASSNVFVLIRVLAIEYHAVGEMMPAWRNLSRFSSVLRLECLAW